MSNWSGSLKMEDDNSYVKMRSWLCWLPILLTIVTGVCFLTSYIVAVARGDVYAFWPYISDTGAKVPESCIFGQLLNITAFLALATMYVRYKLVQAFNSHDRGLRLLNVISIFLGIISCIGISLVANFQETSVIGVHVTGAVMAFVLGVVYCFFHTGITKKMCPTYNSRGIWVIRLCISMVGLIAVICTYIFATIASYEAGTSFTNITGGALHWNATDPGYDEHVTSTVSEWMIGVAFLAFFLTYVNDFQKITIRILPELLVSHLDEAPIVFNSGPTERTGLLA